MYAHQIFVWYDFFMEKPPLLNGAENMHPWRVAEWGSRPKPGRGYSEDRYVASPECFAVLDGVSSSGSVEKIEGLTPGQFAVHIGIEALHDAIQLERVEEVVPFISARLRESLAPYAYTSMPSFVFVAYFPKWRTIVRVGDCSYRLRNPTTGAWVGENPPLAVDVDKDIVRQALIARPEERGLSGNNAQADDAIQRRMHRITREWQPLHRNNPRSPRGYGVMTGETVYHVEYVPVPEGVSEIILASDGYYPEALSGTLVETDAKQEILQNTNARTWHPDDKTYLRIER